MKNKYLVTYSMFDGDSTAASEEIVAEVCMAGSENGVLVLYNYQTPPSPEAPPVPRMLRMFAKGVWKSVQNLGPCIGKEEE